MTLENINGKTKYKNSSAKNQEYYQINFFMLSDRDIIIIGIQPWDIEIGSNCKNLAQEFAKNNRVLYVNAPLDRITLLKKNNVKTKKRIRVNKGLEPDLVKLKDGLWNLYPKGVIESINWIKNNWIYDFLNKRNNRIFANAINSAIQRLGFKDFILFNDNAMFTGFYIKELLRPKVSVYYMRDFLTVEPYWKRHGLRIEPELIKKSDLVVTNSLFYKKYALQFNPNSFMVGQGCDTTIFNDSDNLINAAQDLSSIQKPIIGYIGTLVSRRLDITLIANIAKQRPQWSIVLVGPEDEDFANSELHSIPNIYFLGFREMSLLPNYIKGFDVCINPQLVNETTIGNYPRKIDEYLLMGKPTVATATDAMEYFKDYAYLAKNHQDYVALIEKALNENSAEKKLQRRMFANSHTWENNAKEIYNSIEKVIHS